MKQWSIDTQKCKEIAIYVDGRPIDVQYGETLG